MITPEEFPYIKSLYVNDCYAYKDFTIELHDYKPFSHLILTGKNGSGKSTILKAVNENISKLRSVEATVSPNEEINMVEVKIVKYDKSLASIFDSYNVWGTQLNESVYSFFQAKRTSQTIQVNNPSKETDFTDKLNAPDSTDFFIREFKQYLVNQKVEQAFSQIESQVVKIEQVDQFFKDLESAFRKMFDDNSIRLEFVRSNYEFYLILSDGRRLTFDTLSEGFSAVLSILMDLFTRVDLIRKQVGDYSYNPCGVVLIDEPETHLHLQLQEQVLPLLTNLFPNIQFIAATHSPAVIASIKNATLFDLTTKESRTSEETAGRSYSDLMISHFELDNEYSNIADGIIAQVNNVLNALGDKPDEMKKALQKIYDENSAYLSPTLKIELESLIIQREIKQEVNR